MSDQVLERKTVAFYLALLGLVVLDLALIVWILSPSNHFATSAYASEKAVVSDAGKPSAFEIADSKRSPTQARRRPKLINTSTDATR